MAPAALGGNRTLRGAATSPGFEVRPAAQAARGWPPGVATASVPPLAPSARA